MTKDTCTKGTLFVQVIQVLDFYVPSFIVHIFPFFVSFSFLHVSLVHLICMHFVNSFY
jgi:hypothetical protein